MFLPAQIKSAKALDILLQLLGVVYKECGTVNLPNNTDLSL